MIKTVMIEGRPVELDSSLGWLYRYREQFGRDIMPDLFPIVDAVLSGVEDLLGGVVIEDDKKYLDLEKAAGMIDGGTVAEMITQLSGMEFLTITNIFWAMAKNAAKQAGKTIEPPEEFVNSFDPFPVDEIAPGLLYAIAKSSISSKNSTRPLEAIAKTIPSTLMWSQSPESTEG